MKRSLIKNLSLEVLQENLYRLEIGLDELEYFYSSLLESKEELQSTNEMLKNTIYQIEASPKRSLGTMQVTKGSPSNVFLDSDSSKTDKIDYTASTDCGEITVRMEIQEEIPLVTRKSLSSLSERRSIGKKQILKKNTGNL